MNDTNQNHLLPFFLLKLFFFKYEEHNVKLDGFLKFYSIFRTGLEGFSSEDEDVESEEESSPSTSSSSCGAAAKVEQREEAEPQQSCR